MATMNTPNPATLMKREDYKAIKHMNRASLSDYLSRVYMRGYKAGIEAIMAAPRSGIDAIANDKTGESNE